MHRGNQRPVGSSRFSTILLITRREYANADTYLESNFSYKHCRAPTLYYLSTWDRVVLKKDHSRCGNSTNCQAHQLNPKTYRTQHAAGCVYCPEHGLSSEAISSILIPEKTVVPLVTVDSQRLDSPVRAFSADISRVEAVPSYVAISHVWSDGKGNPDRNFLPLCQLQRLQDCTNALYPSDQHPVPFWMDTLCVPVGKRFWPVRNRALNRMKSTYKSAEKILVFDTSLEIVDSSVAPEEALIRIRYSPWSSRLWTMQEGRLGLNLYFQFRDKSISFDHQPYQGGATGTLPAVEAILNSLTTLELVSLEFLFASVACAALTLFCLTGSFSRSSASCPRPGLHRSNPAATSLIRTQAPPS